MTSRNTRMLTAPKTVAVIVLVAALVLPTASCSKGQATASSQPSKAADGAGEEVTTLGSAEVTAKLVEILGTFPPNDLYDYVYVLKYDVQETHRGEVKGKTIFVGHYNPLKARDKAADARVEGIGGDLKRFKAGDVHRMALAEGLDEHYMGPIINKYAGKIDGPIYWAIWTNRVGR